MKEIKQIIIDGLKKAFEVHESLGQHGEESIEKNQFNETALRVDIECEGVIIDYMQKLCFPIKIFSEEHGLVCIKNKKPCYLGLLDGLDGSGVYKKQRGTGRYGTMFAIFKGTDPCYDDYIGGGIMEHSTKRLFFYSKGNGAFIMELENGKITQIKSSNIETLNKNVLIYIDEYFEINRKVFSEKLEGFQIHYLGSSAVYYADVASGVAGLALECTRKGNLEIAIAYGLIKESGGVMIDMKGKDIGPQKYLEFGQKENLPIITASTLKLALALLDYII